MIESTALQTKGLDPTLVASLVLRIWPSALHPKSDIRLVVDSLLNRTLGQHHHYPVIHCSCFRELSIGVCSVLDHSP